MDELKRVIGKAMPNDLTQPEDLIAAAVRSFMGAPEVVSRAEHAAARTAGVGVGSLEVPVVQMTRAALSAAIGEDIGGGRGC